VRYPPAAPVTANIISESQKRERKRKITEHLSGQWVRLSRRKEAAGDIQAQEGSLRGTH
jgi:hypothetical protein